MWLCRACILNRCPYVNPVFGLHVVILCRSNLVPVVKLLKNTTITTKQKKEIHKSPFGYLLLGIIDDLDEDDDESDNEDNAVKEPYETHVRKNDLDILHLIQQYQKGTGGEFKLGAKSVWLKENELALIFGICSGTTPITLSIHPTKPKTRFADQIMEVDTKGQRIISIKSLKSYFDRVVKKNTDEDAKDVARVLTLFVLATVFCPNTGSRISWSYLEYVCDLEKSKSYAWSKLITNEQIKDLETKTPNNVQGCTVGLLVKISSPYFVFKM